MARPNKIVVVITGDPVTAIRERRGDYSDIIRQSVADPPADWRAIDARSELGTLRRVGRDTAVIITGSSANVPDRDDWVVDTEAVLRELYAREVPILGVCFGHQLLAQALGGEVIKNPRGREMSTVEIERLEHDRILDGMPPRFRANACHSDTVSRLPDGCAVLAQSPGDPHQCLRFSDICYGVQFHPEFDREVMRGMIDARRPALVDAGMDADALAANASDTPQAQRIFENFLAIAQKSISSS